MKKIVLFILSLIFVSLALSHVSYAKTPFVTRTPDRNDNLTITQDAYDAISDIRMYDNNKFNAPQDMFIDEDDYLYVLDTGNRKIVIFDDEYNFLLTIEEEAFLKPMGIYVRDNVIYVADYGLNEDLKSGKIHILNFDKTVNTYELKHSYLRPNSQVLVINDFIYRPQKIAVDNNGTMYVISEGSYNGVMMISSENKFLNFFATNNVKGNLLEKIKRILYGNNEKAQLTKKIPPAPTNVYLKEAGYTYTVTQTTIEGQKGDTLKKVNNGSINFFPTDMITSGDFSSLTIGTVENVYAVTKSGYIYEYDREGNLLFVFGGPSQGLDRIGLFRNVSSITVNSKNELFVLDDANNNIHILKPTAYAKVVHMALDLYNQGKYVESQSYFEEALKYNSLFDLPHQGIGRSYLIQGEYKLAMEKFKIANNKELYSEALWESRNIFLQQYSGYIIISLTVLLVLVMVLKRKKEVILVGVIKTTTDKIKEAKVVKELSFLRRYIKNPLDSFFEGNYRKPVSYLTGVLYILGLLVIYLLHLSLTGLIFRTWELESLVLIEEIVKASIPLVAFILANYLTSSLMEGEGTFKGIFINTLGALVPIYLIMPLLIVLSNVLTLDESFVYYLGFIIMFMWVFFLLFFMIKDTHNFSVKETILNILLTVFIMLVMVIVVVLFYMMVMQVVEFITSIVKEVIINA